MPAKERVGVVVSNKMHKTIVVAVESRSPSPKYKKTMVRTKRYKVHDEENRCKEGDRVRIRETRPLSRTKRWTLAEVLEGTSRAVTAPQVITELEPEVLVAAGEASVSEAASSDAAEPAESVTPEAPAAADVSPAEDVQVLETGEEEASEGLETTPDSECQSAAEVTETNTSVDASGGETVSSGVTAGDTHQEASDSEEEGSPVEP
ncbi:30S ribosomal protein S17 [Rubidibacter lacunae KORDI 51-2]|uniref:Small ribosomal subunit protein uS17 n=1 Tax=Rubidibacter lacunae KORDI 51-2 TaxID=582515 RepID=U5DNP1_9CHRO|nr:30S ribosomal protein S17 [Rubidibacter lacunae KORDI 51-2]